MRLRLAAAGAAVMLSATAAGLAQAQNLTPNQQFGRDVFRELIEINTTHSVGSTTAAAQAMAKRLLAAGFPAGDVQVIGPAGSKNWNLVARFRGNGGPRRPILLLAHLDVVEAKREDWSVDPFTLLERDGFFYGRGTMDIKDGAAILVSSLVRLKQEGFTPDRDLILALTAGEEGGGDYNGVQWLVDEHRELIDAAYCVNMDAGDPHLKAGKRILRTVQASEKTFLSFRLETINAGGHSSLPSKDNAIYRLAAGLTRLAAFDFPVALNDVTRTYFERMSKRETGQVAADMRAVAQTTPDPAAIGRLAAGSPYYNAIMRTTCVATMAEAGHAENALPQLARATVNCRLLPSHSPADVEATLKRVLADSQIHVAPAAQPLPSPATPLEPEVMQAVERTTASLWPGVPVVPVMETGATDGVYLRNGRIPTYGISGVFIDIDDVRAHGKDERIGVQEYYDGLEYIYQLIRTLSSK